MSSYYIGNIICTNELTHHGILGQKWGVRRYQNSDGSLTAEGRIRYGSGRKNSDYDRNGPEWSKANTTNSYNDHEYYAFEYQDDPAAKKAIKSAFATGDALTRLIDSNAKAFYSANKKSIDEYISATNKVATITGKTPEDNEHWLYEEAKKRYPSLVKAENDSDHFRTLLKESISSAVENGAFNEVFKDYPPINYREDYKSTVNLIDGRKSVIAAYIANTYSSIAPSYGFDYINPSDFVEVRELKNGKIGRRVYNVVPIL